ncbi:MAG: alpha/beta hydrolase [Candidatus Rokuibacteriota bacterium]
MITEQAVTLAAGDGADLETRLAVPPAPRAGIVICHPHPLYGGDMDNPVVVRVQEVCGALGLATLRFNFRGAGRSTGTHDGGRAEQRDVQAALGHLAAAIGGAPLAVAGYSFGAVVAAQVAARQGNLGGLALVAPPLGVSGEGPFAGLEGFGAPLLVVGAGKDEYCPPEALDALARRLPQAEVRVVAGANHFFLGKLFPLGQIVDAWAGRLA